MHTPFLLSSAAVLFALAASCASAQDYDRTGQPVSYGGSEDVIVIAPPWHAPRSSVTGAPIEDVAMSQSVRFDDLDLRTADGARELRDRVRSTARDLCRRLDVAYPVSASDSPPCYRTAMEDGLAQANAAIDDARENGD